MEDPVEPGIQRHKGIKNVLLVGRSGVHYLQNSTWSATEERLGVLEQPPPLSAEKREIDAKHQDGEGDGNEGETDCCAGAEIGQSGWSSWRDESVILCNRSSEVSKRFTRLAFNIRELSSFKVNTTVDGLTAFGNIIPAKFVSSQGITLENLLDGWCKLNGDE